MENNETKVQMAKSIGKNIIVNYNALLVLVVLIIISSQMSPFFLTHRNIFNILMQNVHIILLSLGVMLTIMSGGIDLSVAAVTGTGNVLLAIVITTQFGRANAWFLIIGILAAVVLGCLFGLINGFLIGKMRMPAFITTLAMMMVGQGVAYMMTGGSQIPLSDFDAASGVLTGFAMTRDPLFNIQLAVYCVAVVVLIFWFIMRYTSFGRIVLAIGSNEAAVHLAGINTTKYKIIIYIISGGLAALAGVFLAGRTALGMPMLSEADFALTAVAACVIGGVSLSGGKGNVPFTIVGVLIFALITNIMNLAGMPAYPQMIAQGAIIILAILARPAEKV